MNVHPQTAAPGEWIYTRDHVVVTFRGVRDLDALASQLAHWREVLTRAELDAVLIPELELGPAGPALRYPAPADVGVSLSSPKAFGELMRVMAIIATALDTLHTRGLVHGALSLSSLWWMPNGRLVFPDAALATALDGLAAPHNTVFLYRAPEVWHDQTRVPESDQYSLAAIAYELFTHTSREAARRVEGIVAIEPVHLEPMELMAAGAPTGIADALQRALAASPRSRFESCAAFVEALQRGLDAVTRSAEVAQHAKATQARRRPVDMGAVVRIVALLAAVVLIFWYRPALRRTTSELWNRGPTVTSGGSIAGETAVMFPDKPTELSRGIISETDQSFAARSGLSMPSSVVPSDGSASASADVAAGAPFSGVSPANGRAPDASARRAGRNVREPNSSEQRGSPTAERARDVLLGGASSAANGVSDAARRLNAAAPSIATTVQNAPNVVAALAGRLGSAEASTLPTPGTPGRAASGTATAVSSQPPAAQPTDAGMLAPPSSALSSRATVSSTLGTVILDVASGSRVYVDGVLLRGSLTRFQIPSGTHDVDILAAGGISVRRRIVVGRGDSVVVRYPSKD